MKSLDEHQFDRMQSILWLCISENDDRDCTDYQHTEMSVDLSGIDSAVGGES